MSRATGGVVVITGGSRGIGAATARLAAVNGCAVCIAYRVNRAAADAVVRAIVDAGSPAVAVQADVAKEGDVIRLFEAADRLGRLSGLVNNAGASTPWTRRACNASSPPT
jgi:NAD(P)-dependent dehydrogenase (short-subunit alcohol dehydrogenase family)